MTFLEECIDFTGVYWERYQRHPWIKALFAGELREDQFEYWLTQDLPYIGERTASLAFHKVPPHNPWARLQREYDVRSGESRVELQMLKKYGDFALSRWAARPRREAFVNFFIRTFYEGTFGDICCAVYPCYSFYNTFGVRYLAKKPTGLLPLQVAWTEQWTEPFYKELQEATAAGINEYGAHSTEYEREKMRWIFLRGTQHQISIFDTAWDCSDPWGGELEESGVLAGPPPTYS